MRLLRRSDARRRPKAPRPQFPRAVEDAYRRELLRRVKATHQLVVGAVEREIARAGGMPGDVRQDNVTLSRLLQIVERVRVVVTETMPVDVDALGQRAAQLDLFATRQVVKTVERLARVKVASSPAAEALYSTWVEANVSLITSIDSRYFSDIERVVGEGVRTGRSTADLMRDIEERYQVSQSRAELIARDQVAKLNGDLTQQRQKELGVRKYQWLASDDERVREEHAALDGQVFSWDDPPPSGPNGEPGHPGVWFQCRCTAVAALDDEHEAELVAEAAAREERRKERAA